MMTNCKYYDNDDIQKIKTKPNSLFIPSKCMNILLKPQIRHLMLLL